eukprot:2600580-Amphidinium_carterae.2
MQGQSHKQSGGLGCGNWGTASAELNSFPTDTCTRDDVQQGAAATAANSSQWPLRKLGWCTP